MKKSIIYKLNNLITGEIYIGQTANFNQRMSKYRRLCCKSQVLLYKSIKKYGWINFFVSIIEETTLDKIDELETFYILKFNSYFRNNPLGLNMTESGRASFRGCKHTKERNERMSKIMKGVNLGRKFSEEGKRNVSINHYCRGKFEGNHPNSKRIYQYNINFEYVAEFASLSTAAMFLKCPPGQLSGNVGRVESPYCEGYFWSYQKSDILIVKKAVVQFDLKGNFLKLWRNSKVVSNYYKYNYSGFNWATAYGKTGIYDGFIWRVVKEKEIILLIEQTKKLINDYKR